MEEESISTVNYVPSFARGLNILLVHSNTLSLMYLSSLLEQYTFKVTATDEIPVAVSMICNHEDRFKLVMVKVSMLGINALSFLNLLHEKEIPVIFISSGGFDDVIWEALAKGSCYFLEEPILLKDLKYLWQHVYYSKQAQNAIKRNHDDNGSMQREKKAELWPNYKCAAMEIEERREHKVGYADQKKRVVWTPELHLKFTEAVALLGDKNARPKAILNLMNVPDLTARQISSHMQKYKSHLKREQITNDVRLSPASTPSSFSVRTPSSFGSQSYLRFPVPESIAPLNASQKQDQFVINYAETEESDILQVKKSIGDPSFAHEMSTGLANNRSQSLGSIVGNPLLGASTGQIQYQSETEYDYIIKMLEEDCDTNNCFGNGVINPDDVEQYSEMLRTVLENSSSPSTV
ncbi:hypothetical protein VNO77_42384 [Canavalia gladiata]|uniref:Uncharacterized protein n=1 Tax=Canavalia gladiata TaxID=3824 RepID=A0AAN9K046_CANGL